MAIDTEESEYGFLHGILDDDRISTSESARNEHGFDWGTAHEEGSPPAVVVWPETTEEVSAILRESHERGIPTTPYAAGTSLEGNPVPVAGGISLDVSRMDAVVEIRPEDFQIDVQPGILGGEMNEALGRHGLFLPPLPASGKISTIGGMIANDASGMQTVKYGEVHDWVLRLEAVLPDGTVIETGSRASKTSSGYNLMDLLVGSEGTLAVITEITMRVAGIPEQKRGGRVIFEDRTEASRAISDVIQSGVDVAKIELIDAMSAEMTNEYLGTELPDAPMMFVEFHANHSIDREIEFFESILANYETTAIELTDSPEEITELWELREEMADALEPYDPELTPLTPGDVTVPISEFAGLIDYIAELEADNDVLIPCFGHAGDGNIHYIIMVREGDDENRALGEAMNKRIVEYALDVGGTATGEHGVGTGKGEYLREEFNEGTVELMKRVKHAFDPENTLNPGKIFPADED